MLKSPLLLFLCLFAVVVLLNACESPGSPDFTTEHALDIPLVTNQKIVVMGGSMALIDTTQQDFDTLFTRGSNGLVSISSEMDFDFGDFSDVIPEIDIENTEIDTEIGIIDVDDFSSGFESEVGTLSKEAESTEDEEVELGVFDVAFSGSGSSGYFDVTGQDPANFPAGTPIPASTAIVSIDLDAGTFQNAVVDEGGIRIEFTNNLGFDISDMEAQLSSEGTPVGGTLVLENVETGTTESGVIEFAAGDFIEVELAIEVQLEWSAQTTSDNAGDLEVDASDENLKVSRAVSDIPAQVLNPSSPELEIDNPNFDYAIVEDSDVIVAGENDITVEIFNNTGLPVTNSDMNGMPELSLFNSDNVLLDSRKSMSNITSPGSGSLGPNETGRVTFDLRNQKLTRVLSFEMDTGTDGGSGLTVDSEDFFEIASTTGKLNFTEAVSDVESQEDILLDDTAEVEGDFVNAEVEEGELVLTFTNETAIPLTIDNLKIFNSQSFVAKNTGRLFSTGSEIGELNNIEVPPGQSVQEVMDISGKGISDEISYEGTASSPGSGGDVVLIQSTEIIDIQLEGNIQLNSATSVLKAQEFTDAGEIELDDENLILENEDHFIHLDSGELRIIDVVNEIDLDLDTLRISFPGIRTGNYQPQDSLVILVAGENRILRSSTTALVHSEPLKDARIYAPDNILIYHVEAFTENTQSHPQGDSIRTVNSTDRIIANVEIQDLNIGFARGFVQPRTILLNDDDATNGEDILDLFNENEVQITEMDGLDLLSGTALKFFEPNLNLFYDSNIGVKTTVYAAIMGVNEDGNPVYLSGNTGSSYQVTSADHITGLQANGINIQPENLIRFDIKKSENGGSVSEAIVFNHENSTIEEFFSNLPEEIRFIGKALVNQDGGEGEISDPIEFNTSMGVDIPLNMATESPAVFDDTLSVDLSNLPAESDDNMIGGASLRIMYENGMPFDVDISLEFLDADFNLITRVPAEGNGQQIKIGSSDIDPDTRFTSTPNSGIIEMTLNREQLERLHQTRQLIMNGDFQTSSQEQVKLRGEDFINLSIFGKFRIETRIN